MRYRFLFADDGMKSELRELPNERNRSYNKETLCNEMKIGAIGTALEIFRCVGHNQGQRRTTSHSHDTICFRKIESFSIIKTFRSFYSLLLSLLHGPTSLATLRHTPGDKTTSANHPRQGVPDAVVTKVEIV